MCKLHGCNLSRGWAGSMPMVGRAGDLCPRDGVTTWARIAWRPERGQCAGMDQGVLKMTRLPGRWRRGHQSQGPNGRTHRRPVSSRRCGHRGEDDVDTGTRMTCDGDRRTHELDRRYSTEAEHLLPRELAPPPVNDRLLVLLCVQRILFWVLRHGFAEGWS
jgi:hypothetical protein